MGGAARLRFAALRAGVEFFDHAAKSGAERRYVVGIRLFSDLISVMIRRPATRSKSPMCVQMINVTQAIAAYQFLECFACIVS